MIDRLVAWLAVLTTVLGWISMGGRAALGLATAWVLVWLLFVTGRGIVRRVRWAWNHH
jgi:hypothetical protein